MAMSAEIDDDGTSCQLMSITIEAKLIMALGDTDKRGCAVSEGICILTYAQRHCLYFILYEWFILGNSCR